MMTEASIYFNGSHNDVIRDRGNHDISGIGSKYRKCFEYCIYSWRKKHNGAT